MSAPTSSPDSPAPLPTRTATVVLVADGVVLGALPPVTVPTPWWQEVGDVVDAVLDTFGVQVRVLRLLSATEAAVTDGGAVTYLAEPGGALPARAPRLTPWTGPDPLAPQPLRAPWAEPGGPAADLAWAVEALADAGRPLAGEPVQVRSWNLSSIWRLPIAGGQAWLKVVPPFYRHEAPLLAALQGWDAVPRVLGWQRGERAGRLLLDHIPDEWGVEPPTGRLVRAVETLAAGQAALLDRVPDLLALGLPDRRDDDTFLARVDGLLSTVWPQLEPRVRAEVPQLVAALPVLLEQRRAAGLPDTLVHGDAHLGNVRATAGHLVVLDWGDAHVGCPASDLVRLVDGLSPTDAAQVVDAAERVWRAAVPGCDPASAIEAGRILGPLESALVWQGFLDAIEPDERVYHQHDPAAGVGVAVALLTAR